MHAQACVRVCTSAPKTDAAHSNKVEFPFVLKSQNMNLLFIVIIISYLLLFLCL